MIRSLLVILVLVAVELCFHLNPNQGLRAEDKQPSTQSANPVAKKIIITKKTTKKPGGYFIQGQTPSEIFRILNHNHKILDKIVKSGRVATIEGRSIAKDKVNIEMIDGHTYGGRKGTSITF